MLGSAAALFLNSLGVSSPQVDSGTPVYLNPKEAINRRVDDLLGRMTLKEKVGQLNLPCVYVAALGKDIASKTEACKRFGAGTYTGEVGWKGRSGRAVWRL